MCTVSPTDIEREGRINRGECHIRKIPRNGQIVLPGEISMQLHYNDVIPNFTTIRYTCNSNHYVNGSAMNFCVFGEWASPVPDCVPKCT